MLVIYYMDAEAETHTSCPRTQVLSSQRKESNYFERVQEKFLKEVVFELGLVKWSEGNMWGW